MTSPELHIQSLFSTYCVLGLGHRDGSLPSRSFLMVGETDQQTCITQWVVCSAGDKHSALWEHTTQTGSPGKASWRR